MELNADDKLLTRNTLTSEDQCERHTGEMLSYYCRSHHMIGCGTCMTLNHRNCLLGYIPDIVGTDDIDGEFKQFIAALENLSGDLCDIAKQSKENNEIIDSVHDKLVHELKKLKYDVIKEIESNAKEVEDKLADLKEHDGNNMHEINTRCSECSFDVKDLKSKSEQLKEDGKVCQLYILMKKSRCKLDKHAEMVTNTKEESKLTLSIKDCKLETEVFHSQIHLNDISQKTDERSKKSVNQSKVKQMLGRLLSTRGILSLSVPLVIAAVAFMFARCWVSEQRRDQSVLQFNVTAFPFGDAAIELLNQDCDGGYYCVLETFDCVNVKLAYSKESIIISHTVQSNDFNPYRLFSMFNMFVFGRITGKFMQQRTRNSPETVKGILIRNDNQVYRLNTESADTSTIHVHNISDYEITETGHLIFKGTYNGFSVLRDDLVLLQDSSALILDSKWTYIRTIRFDDFVKRLIYIQTSHDNLALFAIDETSETVVKFDLDGNALHTYRNARLQSPAGLTLDKHGYVYVIGYMSNNIHRLTPQLELLQIIELESKPFSISYSGIQNTLYIGLKNECFFYIIDIHNGPM